MSELAFAAPVSQAPIPVAPIYAQGFADRVSSNSKQSSNGTAVVVLAAAAVAGKSRRGRRPALKSRGGEDGYVGRFDGTQKTVSTDEQEETLAAEGTRGRTAGRWSILSER